MIFLYTKVHWLQP